MENQNEYNAEEIFSKALRAGRRTYFFDLIESNAGDYSLTITESKKFTNEDGTFFLKNIKFIFTKRTFLSLILLLKRLVSFIIENKGEEVISEKHDKDFDKKKETMVESEPTEKKEERRGERFC